MGSSKGKTSREKEQEGKRVPPGYATSSNLQMAEGTDNLWQQPSQPVEMAPLSNMKTTGLSWAKMTFSKNKYSKNPFTPKNSFWVGWSMRKSNRTIPRCQTGKKNLTKQKKCSRVTEMSPIWPPPGPVLTIQLSTTVPASLRTVL